MSDAPEQVRELVNTFYGLFENPDADRARAILAGDWENHPADEGRSADRDGFIGGIGDLRNAFRGLTITIQTVVVEPPYAVARITVSGVQVGAFGGHESTGREASFSAMDMHRIEGGRIRATWHFERLEELGV